MKSKSKKNTILLIALIIAQLFWTTYVYVFQKQGCHSDEIWSYGLANSYYQPFIYLNDGVFIDDATLNDTINFNEWSTGEAYHNYITVQKGERFAYGSVYHNQSLDHHPPLYYFLLHTICSFFPNTFSFWFAYFLNCIFLVVTQIFLFKLIKILSKSENTALLGCLLYGAGTGALSTFIFLRQYSLLTMLAVVFSYFNAVLYTSDKFNLKKHMPPIAITAFLLFMTHYTGIAYAGVFTACFCIYLLCRKQIKKMFIYGGTMLGTLLIYFAVYPASIMQLGYSSYEKKILPYIAQLKQMLCYVSKYNLGFKISMYYSPTRYIIMGIIFSLILISIPLCYLFRNESWFIRFRKAAKELPHSALEQLKKANYICLFMFISSIILIMVMADTTDIVKMDVYAMRYIFMTFPLLCVIFVILIKTAVSHLPKIKNYSNITLAIIVIFTVTKVNITAPTEFLCRHYGEYQNTEKLLKNKNCLIVLPDDSAVWSMSCYSHYLRNADNVFFTSANSIDYNMTKITASGHNVDYVIISLRNLELSKEDIERINGWLPDESDSIKFIDDCETQFDEIFKFADCSDTIKQLNDGCAYDILFGLNINNGDMNLVLELK